MVSLFFSSFVLTASANDDIPADDFNISLKREVTQGSTTATYNFDYTVSSFNSNLNIYRPVDFSNFWASGGSKIFLAFNTPNLIAGHEYQLTFTIGLNFNANYTVKVLNGSQNVFEDSFRGDKPNEISVSFTAPDYVSPTHQVSIILTLPQQYSFGTATTGFMFSKYIGWNDNTDNPGWLGKILQNFTRLGDRISGFFSNLTSSISSFFTSLGDRISGFFTDLKTNIGNWFSKQAQKIQDFYNGVKQWFKQLGDRIQGFFVDLYNDIVEGLKRLFIPADGYFESKKTELETFANEHFGAMYQAPSVMADLIKKFLTISPKQPSITMPAIQFDFDGKRYVLSESVTYSFAWVNDSSHMLYYFYRFYRGFVIVLLFVWFGNFCIKKYNEVFGGRQE